MIIIIFISIILILIFEPYIFRNKLNNNNEYGSSRFSTKNEIKKNFECEKLNKLKNAGVPILFNKKLTKCWFDNLTSHYVYLGSSGSGKTSTIVVPMLTFFANAKNKKSIIVTDPKGEIFELTSLMFKNNNYNVITLDFRNYMFSNKINLLENVINNYNLYLQTNELKYFSNVENETKNIADLIFNSKNSNDPFWENSASNLLLGLIYLFLEEFKNNKIKKEQINLTSLAEFGSLLSNKEEMNKLKLYLELKQESDKSRSYLLGVLNSSENVFKTILSVYEEKMSLFKNVVVQNVTSNTTLDLKSINKKPTIIYINVPDEKPIFNLNVSLIVNLLYTTLIESADNEKEYLGVEWVLDEFGNFPALNNVEAMVSISRSRKMRFHFFIQSFSQLNNVYGKERSNIIIDNCGLIYLKTNDFNTACDVAKKLGKRTIESSSISCNGKLIERNVNVSRHLISRELMTPNEIEQLRYKTIIFPIVGFPIIRKTIVFEKFKIYENGKLKRIKKELLSINNVNINNIINDIGKSENIRNEEYNLNSLLSELIKFKNIKILNKKEEQGKILITLNRELTKMEEELLKINCRKEKYYELETNKNILIFKGGK